MWKDIIKRDKPFMRNEATGRYSKAHEIMLDKYGEEYRKATESISPRHTKYGNEYMFYLRLMQNQKMTKEEAAKQTYTPRQGPDDSESYF